MAGHRNRRLAAVLASAAAGALVVLAVVRIGRNDSPTGSERAAVRAREACTTMRIFVEQVEADAGARRVLELLDSAMKSAEGAADADPAWRPLAGGIQAVHLAVEEDDPEAARVGLDVVAASCERAELPIDRQPIGSPSG